MLMSGLQILIAVEHRSHREALAEMLRAMRPEVEIHETDPTYLDRFVIEHEPQLVISSRASEFVETRVFGWAVLYPDGQNYAVLGQAGQRSNYDNIRVEHLLALIDDALSHLYV
jgi:hypothetical protein